MNKNIRRAYLIRKPGKPGEYKVTVLFPYFWQKIQMGGQTQMKMLYYYQMKIMILAR